MRGRQANCLLTLLLVMTLAINRQSPGVSASVILRGRWAAVVDEADVASSGTTHLRSLVRVLGDHQRHRPDVRRLSTDALLNADRELIGRLLRAVKHQNVGAGEERIDDESGRPASISHNDDARSTVVLRRLSPGDYQDSLSPDESVENRLQNYRDEIERIRDAIADSGWYAEEEPTNEDEDEDNRPIGVLNPFRRQVEPASSVLSRLRRVRRDFRRAISGRKLPTHCDQLPQLVNESCNSLPEAVESCQNYLMCIACNNSEREDECALRHATPTDSPCSTTSDDVTVTCGTDAQQVLADARRRLPVKDGACAVHLQCARFHVA